MRSWFVVVGVVVGFCAPALANPPLNLSPLRPDVASEGIQIDYDFMSHVLTASGFTQNMLYSFNPSEQEIQLGGDDTFFLQAHIGPTGAIAPGSALLQVWGGAGGTNTVLLMESHTLSQFGNDFGLLEFVFSNGTGLLNPGYIGTTGVILTDFTQGFDFSDSFSNFGIGTADSFLIPAPAPAAILAMAAGIVARRRRR